MLTRVVFAVLASAASLSALAAEALLELQSTISEVTVYGDRAEVQRVAKRSLEPGDYVLAFRGLPDQLDPNSVRVNGAGDALLQDIRFERRQLAQTSHEKLRQVEHALDAARDSFRVVTDNIQNAQREAAFVQSIADGLTRTGSKEVPVELDPAKWSQMVAYYRGKLDGLGRQIRTDEARKRQVEADVNRYERERSELAGGESKVSNDVEVTVTVRKSTNLRLELTYVVYGASWNPLYDIRVSSETKKLELTYKAQIRQNTAEPWENVKVKLSTASPSQGGGHPELTPWHISYYSISYNDDFKSMAKQKRSAPAMAQMMNEYEEESKISELAAPAPPPVEVATAQVETGATSVVFVPEGKASITNDNQPSTVVVAIKTFSAAFRYSTVPKLSQFAYLKAQARNESDYPLLPGRANVFFDNAFVTTSNVALVAPGEEFWTFLGIDKAIAVEYKLIRRYQEDIAKRTKVSFEYQIMLTNNKKTRETVVVWDQLPISSEEEIQVECTAPEFKEGQVSPKKNDQQFIEWYFELDQGKKVTVPLSFSVKYPKGRSMQGL